MTKSKTTLITPNTSSAIPVLSCAPNLSPSCVRVVMEGGSDLEGKMFGATTTVRVSSGDIIAEETIMHAPPRAPASTDGRAAVSFMAENQSPSARSSAKRLSSDRGRQDALNHSSHHSEEVTYYSETEIDSEEEEDDDCDSSIGLHASAAVIGSSCILRRESSRKSLGSTASTSAFTLAVDDNALMRDDMSSLACDGVDYEVDDISDDHQKQLTKKQYTDIHQLRELFTNTRRTQVSRLGMGDALLEESEDVGEVDDDNDEVSLNRRNLFSERSSSSFHDFDSRHIRNNYSELEGLDNEATLHERFHQSMCIQQNDPFISFRSSGGRPKSPAPQFESFRFFRRPSLLDRNGSNEIPSELDLEQAKKFIAQLASSVDDVVTPATTKSPTGEKVSPISGRKMQPSSDDFSNSKESSVGLPQHSTSRRSQKSEFSEWTIEDDEDDDEDGSHSKDKQCIRTRLSNSKLQGRESFLSADYTEVIVDEEEEYEEEEIIEEEEFIEEEADSFAGAT